MAINVILRRQNTEISLFMLQSRLIGLDKTNSLKNGWTVVLITRKIINPYLAACSAKAEARGKEISCRKISGSGFIFFIG